MSKETKVLSYQLPESLKRKLSKGEYAAYQLVDVYYTKDGRFSGRTAGIPNKDIILTKEGDLVPIAFVEGYNSDGSARLGQLWFNIDSECTILCLAGAKHAAMYNFLEISNYNESNPDRDPTINPVYRRVDSLNQAKQTRSQRGSRINALKAAITMTDAEIEIFLNTNKAIVPVRTVITPDGKKDFEAIRDGIEKWAEHNPERFLSLSINEKSTGSDNIETLIAWAKAEEMIGFDNETKSWYGADGKPFLKAKSITNGIPVVELVGYLRSTAGQRLFEKLSKAKEQK